MFSRKTKPERFAGRRARMVARQLRRRNIRDEEVLAAMGEVPREHFLPREHRAVAYQDRALPLTGGQTMSQPYMVAAMTEALELSTGQALEGKDLRGETRENRRRISAAGPDFEDVLLSGLAPDGGLVSLIQLASVEAPGDDQIQLENGVVLSVSVEPAAEPSPNFLTQAEQLIASISS